MRLIDGLVTFEMKEHYASSEEAQEQLKPYLRNWERDVSLSLGLEALRFVFESAEIVDRGSPSAPPTQVRALTASLTGYLAVTPLTLSQYPEPPSGFIASPDVETMWQRYEGHLAGREPLAAMAYMCLTVLEANAEGRGKRKKAAGQYNIDEQVLENLGILTSEVGDPQTARKMPGSGEFQPHTGAEVAWIIAVVKALIRRAGEWAFDPNAARPKLTMADFPDLGTGKS